MGWPDTDILPYAFNSLQGEAGKLALTFSSGLPLWELVSELDEHFGIIADLDILRREFYSIKQGTHETVSKFAGQVCYQLMELQATFPEVIAHADKEEIKKGRLYGGLKLHLRSAMNFCHEMANEGKGLTYHQLLKIARHTETDYKAKDFHKHQDDKSWNHNSKNKLCNDFGGKPAMRAIKVSAKDLSDSSESEEEQTSVQSKDDYENETYEARVMKAGLSFEKDYKCCFRCEKSGHLARDCTEEIDDDAKKNLNTKGVSKKGE